MTVNINKFEHRLNHTYLRSGHNHTPKSAPNKAVQGKPGVHSEGYVQVSFVKKEQFSWEHFTRKLKTRPWP